jgi:hypothetical protein
VVVAVEVHLVARERGAVTVQTAGWDQDQMAKVDQLQITVVRGVLLMLQGEQVSLDPGLEIVAAVAAGVEEDPSLAALLQGCSFSTPVEGGAPVDPM